MSRLWDWATKFWKRPSRKIASAWSHKSAVGSEGADINDGLECGRNKGSEAVKREVNSLEVRGQSAFRFQRLERLARAIPRDEEQARPPSQGPPAELV